MVDRSRETFTVQDDIPVSEKDDFLAMAINGYKAGIVKEHGLLFVGSNELDYSVLQSKGLKETKHEDRGREATFYQDENGKDIVKVLYSGLCIVLNDDMAIAKELARTGIEMDAKKVKATRGAVEKALS